jgi:hypothetical protein
MTIYALCAMCLTDVISAAFVTITSCERDRGVLSLSYDSMVLGNLLYTTKAKAIYDVLVGTCICVRVRVLLPGFILLVHTMLFNS